MLHAVFVRIERKNSEYQKMLCRAMDIEERINIDNVENGHKTIIYCKSINSQNGIIATDQFRKLSRRKPDNELCIKMSQQITIGCHTRTDTHFLKEFPGNSPTVAISWFVAKTYLANLYLTMQRNCSATEDTCNEIIDLYKQSRYNQQFAEHALPVAFSTHYSSIYDNELQEMLGLYSLFSFIWHRIDRCPLANLAAYPVQFALYLKVRCAVVQLECLEQSNHTYTYNENHQFYRNHELMQIISARCAAEELLFERLAKSVDIYNEPLEGCQFDNRGNNGGLILSMALKVLNVDRI